MSRPHEAALREGAMALGLDLPDRQVDQLLDYLGLIAKWNRVYNLTAVREPDEMVTHHLLDSLAVLTPLARETGGRALRLMDVGAGAGLPGVVIAIARPDVAVDCVDTVAKKAAFVQQVSAELKLANLRGVHGRVETQAGPYDVISSRAFASLADFVTGSAQALAHAGSWMALKGRAPDAEVAAVPVNAAVVFHVEQLQVPGLEAERCLVWLKKPLAIT